MALKSAWPTGGGFGFSEAGTRVGWDGKELVLIV